MIRSLAASCGRRFASYDEDLVAQFRKMFDQVGGIQGQVQGKTVAIKVNLSGGNRFEGYTPGDTHWVHPRVVGAVTAVLGQLGGKGIDLLGIPANHEADLAARSTVAMVAGMAAFGATFFGGTRPPRDIVVEELAQATLHGFLHRSS